MGAHRIFVEKNPEFRVEAESLRNEFNENLSLSLRSLRLLNVYDLFGFSDELLGEMPLHGVRRDGHRHGRRRMPARRQEISRGGIHTRAVRPARLVGGRLRAPDRPFRRRADTQLAPADIRRRPRRGGPRPDKGIIISTPWSPGRRTSACCVRSTRWTSSRSCRSTASLTCSPANMRTSARNGVSR